jgi:predicted DNA-binding protein (MmcQ/YjbR family)
LNNSHIIQRINIRQLWFYRDTSSQDIEGQVLKYEEFNAYCGSFKATSHVVQWGGADVWKVVDKVFAIGGWQQETEPGITFKVSDIAYEMLKDQPGLRPATYAA